MFSIKGVDKKICLRFARIPNSSYLKKISEWKRKIDLRWLQPEPIIIIGGFPIVIETQISKLITYRKAIFIL